MFTHMIRREPKLRGNWEWACSYFGTDSLPACDVILFLLQMQIWHVDVIMGNVVVEYTMH